MVQWFFFAVADFIALHIKISSGKGGKSLAHLESESSRVVRWGGRREEDGWTMGQTAADHSRLKKAQTPLARFFVSHFPTWFGCLLLLNEELNNDNQQKKGNFIIITEILRLWPSLPPPSLRLFDSTTHPPTHVSFFFEAREYIIAICSCIMILPKSIDLSTPLDMSLQHSSRLAIMWK